MKLRIHFFSIAAAAAFAVGALGVPLTASATTWETGITPKMSVIGTPQMADRTAPWTKQVSAMQQLRGTTRGAAPLGFFEQARILGGYPAYSEVASR